MDLLTGINVNVLAGMVASALAVCVGVKIREIGLRMYILVLITAVLWAAAMIETWFSDSTLMRSATVGWIVGYITDDVLLTINSLLPNFVKDLLNTVLDGIRKKVTSWLGIDNNKNSG